VIADLDCFCSCTTSFITLSVLSLCGETIFCGACCLADCWLIGWGLMGYLVGLEGSLRWGLMGYSIGVIPLIGGAELLF
jgi:hypothetical protein